MASQRTEHSWLSPMLSPKRQGRLGGNPHGRREGGGQEAPESQRVTEEGITTIYHDQCSREV
jgi:hypothetical protein